MSTSSSGDPPLPLPQFIKLLSASKHLTLSQSMTASSKLLPNGYNNLSKLKQLNHHDMIKIGLDDDDIRRGIMAVTGKGDEGRGKGKKRRSDLDQPLPTSASLPTIKQNFDFDEILYEPTLLLKSVVINRAPVMTAWATIVAERLGFRRQEALSIAQVYTSLNANSKGVSLGILPKMTKDTSSQPFVELMGRKIPVISMQDNEWRGIDKGSIVDSGVGFSYLKNSFRQQLGGVMGSLRLLSESFPAEELNEKGYGLYCEFRPESTGWGKKAEMLCGTILGLRRELTHDLDPQEEPEEDRVVKTDYGDPEEEEEELESRKKLKLELEDVKEEEPVVDPFDAALDDDLDLEGWDEAEFFENVIH